MQRSSVAISQSPHLQSMENNNLPAKLDLNYPQTNNGNTGPTARCLFGVPDPNLALNLVRDVVFKNALSFGKKFNFDIIQGEPFPSYKTPSEGHSSDEENTDMDIFLWTKSYDEDHMTKCNSSPSPQDNSKPLNRHQVSLLIAPIHPYFTSTSSSSDDSASGKTFQKKKSLGKWSHHSAVKKHNILNTLSSKSGKKTFAQQIITKYTYANRVIKHALKKPKKSIISATSSPSNGRVQVL